MGLSGPNDELDLLNNMPGYTYAYLVYYAYDNTWNYGSTQTIWDNLCWFFWDIKPHVEFHIGLIHSKLNFRLTWSPHFQSCPLTTLVPIFMRAASSGPLVGTGAGWGLLLVSSKTVLGTGDSSWSSRRSLGPDKDGGLLNW